MSLVMCVCDVLCVCVFAPALAELPGSNWEGEQVTVTLRE